MGKPVGTHVQISVDPFGVSPDFISEEYPVIDLLSSQFTIEADGRIVYLFYSEEGMVWRNSEEASDE
jgi:hypothetical protein